MHHLLGQKVALFVLLLVFASPRLYGQGDVQSYAQRMADLQGGREIKIRGQNKPNYDEKFLHYGFYVGLNFNNYRLRRSDYFVEQFDDQSKWDTTLRSPIMDIQPKGSPGLTVGFILNMGTDYFPWMAYFDLRVLPNVTFYQRYVEYKFRNGERVNQLHQSTYSYIELPILVKYKSKRRNNVRMYMLGGIKPAFEVGGRRNDLTEEFLRLNTSDFSIDYGFGVELFYPYFNFSPEIRFSHGVQNLWSGDPNVYSRSLDRIYSHSVTLIFNFEG